MFIKWNTIALRHRSNPDRHTGPLTELELKSDDEDLFVSSSSSEDDECKDEDDGSGNGSSLGARRVSTELIALIHQVSNALPGGHWLTVRLERQRIRHSPLEAAEVIVQFQPMPPPVSA